MPSSPVSGAQLGGIARLKGANFYPSTVYDNEDSLGDPLGGWEGDRLGPEASGALNLSTAQKPLAFRSPDNYGIGKNTIGTWQGFDTPWHQRFTSDSG